MNKMQLLAELTLQGIHHPQVLAAIKKISRQSFVPEEEQQYGYEGLAVEAPFDAILVTARATEVPEALLDQLSPQGCLVMPVGDDCSQELMLVSRQGDHYSYQNLGAVVFVPLQSGII